jgi:hypothetical protein
MFVQHREAVAHVQLAQNGSIGKEWDLVNLYSISRGQDDMVNSQPRAGV